jgi:hypothetical protein
MAAVVSPLGAVDAVERRAAGAAWGTAAVAPLSAATANPLLGHEAVGAATGAPSALVLPADRHVSLASSLDGTAFSDDGPSTPSGGASGVPSASPQSSPTAAAAPVRATTAPVSMGAPVATSAAMGAPRASAASSPRLPRSSPVPSAEDLSQPVPPPVLVVTVRSTMVYRVRALDPDDAPDASGGDDDYSGDEGGDGGADADVSQTTDGRSNSSYSLGGGSGSDRDSVAASWDNDAGSVAAASSAVMESLRAGGGRPGPARNPWAPGDWAVVTAHFTREFVFGCAPGSGVISLHVRPRRK